MFNMLYKEIRLSAHPASSYSLLGMLVIVPAYPYGMVFIFGCLGPYITMMYGRKQMIFTTLPCFCKKKIL